MISFRLLWLFEGVGNALEVRQVIANVLWCNCLHTEHSWFKYVREIECFLLFFLILPFLFFLTMTIVQKQIGNLVIRP